jgi:lysophospholipid hydrolase
MSLDQDKSFYCVVDGMVQVFAQTGKSMQGQSGSWDNEDTNGYQLLNEVGSGGTLSSPFTILSLFTEDVKISWQDDREQHLTMSPDDVTPAIPLRHRNQRTNSDVSQLDLPSPRSHIRRFSESSSASTIHGRPLSLHIEPETQSPTRYEGVRVSSHARESSPPPRDTAASTQLHHGVVARATEDTTLAVIPAEAFRRLTKKFPKATGHIVQGT